jgi:diaminohydroxyphosphoribosylaminopyrimidine deaminase/5-amino-6-(5-phosphoribosylamino)uracil reductase
VTVLTGHGAHGAPLNWATEALEGRGLEPAGVLKVSERSSLRRSAEAEFMREALELAGRGLEGVSPNPLVGSVVVRRGRVVGRGWHERYGGPHAEVLALEDAGEAAKGADLFVSLEPCGHHGKTPPCADAIVRSGVRRVIYACADPNPLTRARGPKILREAGIEVEHGLLRREAEKLNRPFFHFLKTRRPWVILKWGMSLDGKIATTTRESKWITGVEARRDAHRLRRRVDAIVAGTGTILADDPLLTPRPSKGRSPLRVILDRKGRLPLDRRILDGSDRGGPRLYVVAPRVPSERLREVESRGLTTLVLPEKPDGLDIEYLLHELGERGISQLLVEGGGGLAGTFLSRGWVDEVVAYIASRVIGGREAPGPIGGEGIPRLADAVTLIDQRVDGCGHDVRIRGVVDPRKRPGSRTSRSSEPS